MEELWQMLDEFDNYEISSWGRVLKLSTNHIMALSKNQRGFYKISLIRQDGYRSTVQLNLLVAHAFLPGYTETFNTPVHLDGNKEHVFVSNLAWRPRWFAFKYHAQFEDRRSYVTERFVDVTTGEKFDDSRKAAAKYGLLEKDIFLSISNCTSVFPTGQEFRIL